MKKNKIDRELDNLVSKLDVDFEIPAEKPIELPDLKIPDLPKLDLDNISTTPNRRQKPKIYMLRQRMQKAG